MTRTLLLCCALFLAACAGHSREAAPGTPGSIWPAQTDAGRVFYAPRFMASAKQASQALWDSRHAYTALGGEPVSVDASQRWLKVQVQVRETSTKPVYHSAPWRRGCINPSSVTCDDYPDFVEQTRLARKTAVIPLDSLDRVLLFEPGLVRVVHEKGRITEFAAKDGETQKLIADAIVTLARPFGFTAETSPGLGLADLSFSQRSRLGLSAGVLVTGVERGGPAERAGLRYLDVILTADGQALDAVALAARILALSRADARPLAVQAYRWRADPDDPLDKPGPFATELRGPRPF